MDDRHNNIQKFVQKLVYESTPYLTV